MLIYKVIKGEKAAVELLKRMKVLQNDWISWCESFAHIGDITLERIYEKAPEDDGYKEYIILYKTTDREPTSGLYGYNMSDIRHEVYEGIRTGRFSAK